MTLSDAPEPLSMLRYHRRKLAAKCRSWLEKRVEADLVQFSNVAGLMPLVCLFGIYMAFVFD